MTLYNIPDELLVYLRAKENSKVRERREATNDQWTDSSGVVYWVHRWTVACREGCAIHAPSNHSMKDFPQYMRADKSFLVERICGHGIGHPDPDSLAWFEKQGDDTMGVHGCDGCCKGAYPVKVSTKKKRRYGNGWGTSRTSCDPFEFHNEWTCDNCNPTGLTPDDIH